MITKQTIANMILAYMQHQISLQKLIDWAENILMEGEFEEMQADWLSKIVAKIGLANVSNFGLLWEDCEEIMEQLGYTIKVEAMALS